MADPARIAVLASGGGTNLQTLLDRFGRDSRDASVELVIASRQGIGALDRAERARVASVVLDARQPGIDIAQEMLDALRAHRIDLVVLAGYLQLIPDAVVDGFRGRMINIHPALLPAFGGAGMYGMRVHRAVIEAGVRVSGASVHFVDERYDEGAIIAQWPVPVFAADTPETLAARVLRVEHALLPAAVEALVRGNAPGAPDATVTFRLTADGPPTTEEIAAISRPD